MKNSLPVPIQPHSEQRSDHVVAYSIKDVVVSDICDYLQMILLESPLISSQNENSAFNEGLFLFEQ